MATRKPKFDRRMKPTVRPEWRGLWPPRRRGFWWRVGCLVRRRGVKHNDYEGVRKICAQVDEHFPEHRAKIPNKQETSRLPT